MTTMKANANEFETVAITQGRFFSIDSCQYLVDQTAYQYARISKTPLMAFKLATDPNFSTVYVAQNNDSLLNFVFMVKTPQYKDQTDEQVINILKVSYLYWLFRCLTVDACYRILIKTTALKSRISGCLPSRLK